MSWPVPEAKLQIGRPSDSALAGFNLDQIEVEFRKKVQYMLTVSVTS